MKLYENTKLKELLKELVQCDEFKTDYYFQYLYIVNYVRNSVVYRRDLEDCHLNIKKLRSIVSYDNAHKLVRNLVDGGIILTDSKYSKGNYSRKYVLSQDFDDLQWYPTKNLDNALELKFDRDRERKLYLIKSFGKGYKKAIKDLYSISIDKIAALDFIESKKNQMDYDAYRAHKLSVELFDDKFFTVDQSGNRLHTNLTNLPAELRQFLSHSGGCLSQIDIKCSQPTFLGLKLRSMDLPYKKEIDKYLDICQSGNFYEFFAERCGREIDLQNKNVRKYFKISLFRDLFFNKNRETLTCFEEVFNGEFPNIFNFIRMVKSNGNDKLAVLLQKEESSFIFELIGQFTFPSYTIHDSVISGCENIDAVKSSMERLFKEKYNFIPNLSIENLEKS